MEFGFRLCEFKEWSLGIVRSEVYDADFQQEGSIIVLGFVLFEINILF